MIRVFSVAVPSRILTLFISETLIVTGCYLLAAWLDPDVGDLDFFLRFDSGILRILIVVLTIIAGFYFRDLYTRLRIRNRIALVQEMCMIFGIAFVSQGVINYLNHDLTLPRKVMMAGSAFALICLFGWRVLFAATAGTRAPSGKLLFLGMSSTIMQLAKYFVLHPELGFAPVGYLDESSRGIAAVTTSPAIPLPRLGTVDDLDSAVEDIHPTSIVIGRRETIRPWWTDEFLELHFGGVRTEEAATLYETAFGKVCAVEIWPQDLIFTSTFERRSIDNYTQAAFSIVLGGTAALVLAPIAAAIALALKLASREPVLVREQRVGLRGVPFTMYSFRPWLRRSSSGMGPRRRPPFLQRTGLSTLPRLFNVLSGQMALVGPKPERPEFAARLAALIPFYQQRHRLRPGLTGWQQIHEEAKDPGDSISRFEYDLYYMKHLSPSLDFVVLLLCLKKFLVGELTDI